ncbi:uncharacterized protein LOC111618422 [Centruroides sculpturatus]|uniref:uncharacterized protein LOC111618422 n=1 Tax=Centruroides sculpturatus TaxID=218467 RepID=UPI000C6D4963|nr:uncharacterized protein LOC111618422 [Centruroides sculpturatus]
MPDFGHSEVLFTQGSKPMKFYMRPCSEKQRLKPAIEHGGGMLTSKWTEGIYRLIPPDSKKITETGISSKFIDDCIEHNRLLDMSDYEIKSNDAEVSDISDDDSKYQIRTTARCMKTRKEYTRKDDERIISYVLKTKGYNDVKGRSYWIQMQDRKVLPQRTWQSLKEHFVKKIIPNIHTFDLDPKQKRAFLRPFGRAGSEESTSGDEDFEFSKTDDMVILTYILNNDNYHRIKKQSFWKELKQKYIPYCSWMELRNRFFDTIVPSIDKYSLSSTNINRLKSVIKIPNSTFSDVENLSGDKVHPSNKNISATRLASNVNPNHSKTDVFSPEKNNKVENMTEKEKTPDTLAKTKSNDIDIEKSDPNSNSKFPGISWTVVLQAEEPHLLCRGSLDETDSRNKNKNDKHLKLPACNVETKSSENFTYSSSSDVSETPEKNKKLQTSKYRKTDKVHQKSKVLFEKFSMADIEEYLKKTNEEGSENKEMSEKSNSSLQNLLIENLRKSLVNKLHSRNHPADKLLENLKTEKLDNVDSSLLIGLYQNESKLESSSDSKNTDVDMSNQDQCSMDTDDLDIGVPMTMNKISDALSGEWPETQNDFQDTNGLQNQIHNCEMSPIRKNGKIEESTSEHNSLLVNKLRAKIKSIVGNSSFKNLSTPERPSKYRKIMDEHECADNDFNRNEGNALSTTFPFSEREKKKILYEALLKPRETDPPLEIKLSSSIKAALKQIENIKKTSQNWCQSLDLQNVSLSTTSVNEHYEKIKALHSYLYDIYIMSLSHTVLKKSHDDIKVNDILVLLKYLITNGGFSIDDISKLMKRDIQWI